MSEKPDIADLIFNAFSARRERLREGDGARAIRIVGSRYSSEAMALRAFATRSHLPHTWIDLEDARRPRRATGRHGAAVPPTRRLSSRRRRCCATPPPGSSQRHLGLTFRPVPGTLFDLVVIGTGPAGLASAVYGASEGLNTVALDAFAIGGQAGASSRIENYAGFPNGISGEDLVSRTAIQAQRLGARLNAPCVAAGLRRRARVSCRDACPTGARSRAVRSSSPPGPAIADWPSTISQRFEGAGVYYAATDLEARICTGKDVIVVGGGNSAGQAAIYMSQQRCKVLIAIRRDDLSQTMSRYLIERIEANPRIEVLSRTEVRALRATGPPRAGDARSTPRRARPGTVACGGLFCFIGAEPATSWLGDAVALDSHGFVLTDRDLAGTGASVPAVRGTGPVAVRDLDDGGLRGRRCTPRIAQTGRGRRGRGIERGPLGPRAPEHGRPEHDATGGVADVPRLYPFAVSGVVTPEQRRSWTEDGWCVLEEAVSGEDLAAAQNAVAKLFPSAEEMAGAEPGR